MIILNSARMIFIHIHKAGGTSVEVSLSKAMRWNDILLGSTEFGELLQTEYRRLFRLEKHSPAAVIRKIVGTEIWDAYFKWATVRSPYARVASLYSYTASLIEPLLADSSFPKQGSAAEKMSWIEGPDRPDEPPWRYATVRAYLSAYGAVRPFSEYIRSPYLHEEPGFQTQASQLADADGKLLIDQAVKLETLHQTWPAITARLGLGGLPIRRDNATPAGWRKPDAELFAFEDDARLIRERFAVDFELFAYDRAAPEYSW